MTISQFIASTTLAFAIIGGAIALVPAPVEAAGKHISYDALKKNRVPCSQKGSSWKNCAVGKPANPYTRGCSDISRCKRK